METTVSLSLFTLFLIMCLVCLSTVLVMWSIAYPQPVVDLQPKEPTNNSDSIAIVISGLQNRFLKPCVDSLARYVISPHVQAGYGVDVFAVLQVNTTNTTTLKQVDHDTQALEDQGKSMIADEWYLRQTIEELGSNARLIKYVIETAPSFAQLQQWYQLDHNNRLCFQYQNGNEGDDKWKRNILMYDNISNGFREAEKWANKPYVAYIRTRSDNIFFNEHPIYPQMSAKDVLVLACGTYGGVNDKFLVFKSRRAVHAFAYVLDHQAGDINTQYENSESMWGISFRRHGVQWTFLPRYQILMSHLGLRSDGTSCYRWMNEKCITTPDLKKHIIQHECLPSKKKTPSLLSFLR